MGLYKRDYETINLGQKILKFNVPKKVVDIINTTYQDNTLPKHNNYLAGKIVNQHRITEQLPDEINDYFRGCFKLYLSEFKQLQLDHLEVHLLEAWVNEMKENEYNPMHIHRGKTNLGLSSVLCLKKPNTYGEEYSSKNNPTNGVLEFIGSGSGMFNIYQHRHYLSVGDLFIFPYDMWHGVYPFNSTKEVRRTMSFNCDLDIPK